MPRSASRLARALKTTSSRRAPQAHEAELLAELARLYSDADSAFAGWSCPASTECCRFGITGREPYVTSIELLAIRRAVAALGGPKAYKRAAPLGSPGKRTLPVVALAALTSLTLEERTCPLLNADGRCAVYASRPLGCRTFYCDRASKGAPVKHKEITTLVRRMKDLASRHAPDGDLGRPLTRAL